MRLLPVFSRKNVSAFALLMIKIPVILRLMGDHAPWILKRTVAVDPLVKDSGNLLVMVVHIYSYKTIK